MTATIHLIDHEMHQLLERVLRQYFGSCPHLVEYVANELGRLRVPARVINTLLHCLRVALLDKEWHLPTIEDVQRLGVCQDQVAMKRLKIGFDPITDPDFVRHIYNLTSRCAQMNSGSVERNFPELFNLYITLYVMFVGCEHDPRSEFSPENAGEPVSA